MLKLDGVDGDEVVFLDKDLVAFVLLHGVDTRVGDEDTRRLAAPPLTTAVTQIRAAVTPELRLPTAGPSHVCDLDPGTTGTWGV